MELVEGRMIAFLTLELRMEMAQSLKDKRQVTRSLKDRLRSSFNVAVAELEPSSLWNQATIGVVGVSHSRDYLDGLMKNVERAAMRIANNAGAEVTDSLRAMSYEHPITQSLRRRFRLASAGSLRLRLFLIS
jgi:hypothetical protein